MSTSNDIPDTAIRPWRLDDFDAVEATLDDTFAGTWLPEAASAYRESGEPMGAIDEMGPAFFVAAIDGEWVGMVHRERDFVQALHVPAAAPISNGTTASRPSSA